MQVVVFEGGAFEQHSGAKTHAGLSEQACGLSKRWPTCHVCGAPFEDAVAAGLFRRALHDLLGIASPYQHPAIALVITRADNTRSNHWNHTRRVTNIDELVNMLQKQLLISTRIADLALSTFRAQV